MRKLTTEEFIKKCINIYGDYFDFSEFEYKGNHINTEFICKKHGKFTKTPANFLIQGCSKCNIEKIKWDEEKFITESLKIHRDLKGNPYNYEYVDFKGLNTHKVKIWCDYHKEFFLKIPCKHIYGGQGCPKCGHNIPNKEDFIKISELIHGVGRYDCTKVEIKNNTTPVEIICNEVNPYTNEKHGSFFITPNYHIKRKLGCPKCSKNKKLTTEEFIEISRLSHTPEQNENLSYDKSNYVNNRTPIIITCNIHGDFEQTPEKHMSGQGCPKCSSTISKLEVELHNFINSIYKEEIIKNNRNILPDNKEIDVYIPNLKIGFEFNGLYWHNETNKPDRNYHLNKTKSAEDIGVRLIHIWEDEWVFKKEITKSNIKHILGCCENIISATKGDVREINCDISNDFLETNHLNGADYIQSKSYGLYHNNELIQIIVFRKLEDNNYELSRLCTKKDYNVIDGYIKLFNHFKELNNMNIITHCDLRWSNGKEYEELGFECISTNEPDYDYLVDKDKCFIRKNKTLIENNKSKTLKIDRVWNCGYKTYLLKY